MRAKKTTALLLGSATMLATGLVFAGGQEKISTRSERPTVTYSGVYLEGIAGYVARNWWKKLNLNGLAVTSSKNSYGGFTGGIDIGYQFNKYWGIEMGWLDLPTFKLSVNGTQVDKLESWFAYAALKLIAPIFDQFFLYAKGGLTYNYNKDRSPAPALSVIGGVNSDYWSAIAALGVQYYFNRHVSVSLQAAYVPGRSVSAPSMNKFSTPVVYFYTGSIGYKFMI